MKIRTRTSPVFRSNVVHSFSTSFFADRRDPLSQMPFPIFTEAFSHGRARIFMLLTRALEIVVSGVNPFLRSSPSTRRKGQLLHYHATWVRGGSTADKSALGWTACYMCVYIYTRPHLTIGIAHAFRTKNKNSLLPTRNSFVDIDLDRCLLSRAKNGFRISNCGLKEFVILWRIIIFRSFATVLKIVEIIWKRTTFVVLWISLGI